MPAAAAETPQAIAFSTPLPTPRPTPSPSPTPEPTPEPTPFSIVWLADTQTLSYHRKDYAGSLESMGAWIVNEKNARGIQYVVQTGDAVENGFSDWQWESFDRLYSQLENELPFFAIAGNHDIGIRQKSYEGFLARPYVRSLPSDQTFDGGCAASAVFEAGGINFLLLGAGWNAELDAVDWMNDTLRAHPDSVAILLFHGYINPEGGFTVTGKQMFEQVVRQNPNVRLVLCGHIPGSGARIDDLDDDGDGIADRRVHAMIYNFQDYDTDCGQLRLLTFDPLSRDLSVMTYSPYRDRFYRDGYFHEAEFVLENAF